MLIAISLYVSATVYNANIHKRTHMVIYACVQLVVRINFQRWSCCAYHAFSSLITTLLTHFIAFRYLKFMYIFQWSQWSLKLWVEPRKRSQCGGQSVRFCFLYSWQSTSPLTLLYSLSFKEASVGHPWKRPTADRSDSPRVRVRVLCLPILVLLFLCTCIAFQDLWFPLHTQHFVAQIHFFIFQKCIEGLFSFHSCEDSKPP